MYENALKIRYYKKDYILCHQIAGLVSASATFFLLNAFLKNFRN